jgi:hypothetical protein
LGGLADYNPLTEAGTGFSPAVNWTGWSIMFTGYRLSVSGNEETVIRLLLRSATLNNLKVAPRRGWE